ncbi:MAG: tRNA (adenosine(37)-N6)-threonylcarbamoyltransferase complex dimerization subunit type 1 TsaB [Terriglobia bacterium]
MLILALDTTSEWGGAGIFRDDECVATARHQGPTDYSVSLFQDVDGLLEQAGISLGNIDLFAASNGPGSFTGIRVGLAAVRGWAQALEKTWRGVSILEAMVEESRAGTFYALPVLDARRGELYGGLYERAVPGAPDGPSKKDPSGTAADVRFALLGEGALLKPVQVAPFLENSLGAGNAQGGVGCTVIARENDVAARDLQQLVHPPFEWKTITPFLVPSIARLAFRAVKDGRPVLPEEATACYIRRTDAELHLNEHASPRLLKLKI